MIKEKLGEICLEFGIESPIANFEPINSGLINTTFLVIA